MPISIACISHQLLLLEGIEASVAGSEFDVSLVRFQGRLMLDEMVSARISLDEINQGFEAMKSGSVTRSVITFD